MLQQDSSGKRIHVSLSSTRRSPHFSYSSEGRCRGVPFIDERDWISGTSFQLCPYPAYLLRPWALVALVIQREAEHESVSLVLLRAPDHLSDRRPLPRAPRYEPSR